MMFKKIKNYFKNNMESIALSLAAINGNDSFPIY